MISPNAWRDETGRVAVSEGDCLDHLICEAPERNMQVRALRHQRDLVPAWDLDLTE